MGLARREIVSLDETPYYHCVVRCVRRAFLCGQQGDKNYDYRRKWLEELLLLYEKVFAIDLCAYAIMHNHYHVVLHVDQDQLRTWTDQDVVKRWHKLFNGHHLSHKWMRHEILNTNEMKQLQELIIRWRSRLGSMSWFMRVINERIARKANQEDDCTGHFWEGRFKSQALLDTKALLTCMAYVDLNPIRAGIATTLSRSQFTSIRFRLKNRSQLSLYPFLDNITQEACDGLSFNLNDYIALLQWTIYSKNKTISYSPPLLLHQLKICFRDHTFF